MPRLKQVPLAEAHENAKRYYERLFSGRDPVKEPGTATGTPGNWWTVFALVPPIFDHATAQFRHVRNVRGPVREQARSPAPRARTTAHRFVVGSQFVFSQHCKAGRRNGLSEEKMAAIPSWSVSELYSPLERAVLAYTDCLVSERGRVPDATFDALHKLMSDQDILELGYHVMCYNLHAVLCKAMRLEFDDVPERIREVPVPGEGELTSDWAGAAWAEKK